MVMRTRRNSSGYEFVMLSSVKELRMLQNRNNAIPFKPRFLNKIWAKIHGLFWLPCHLCNKDFGGHEWYGSDNNTNTAICPECVLDNYNQTGSYNIAVLSASEIKEKQRKNSLNKLGL